MKLAVEHWPTTSKQCDLSDARLVLWEFRQVLASRRIPGR